MHVWTLSNADHERERLKSLSNVIDVMDLTLVMAKTGEILIVPVVGVPADREKLDRNPS